MFGVFAIEEPSSPVPALYATLDATKIPIQNPNKKVITQLNVKVGAPMKADVVVVKVEPGEVVEAGQVLNLFIIYVFVVCLFVVCLVFVILKLGRRSCFFFLWCTCNFFQFS